MNVSYDNDEIIKRCFKCDEIVYDILKVIYNGSTGTILLWNKFQIFVYEDLEFECVSKVIVPDFQIFSIVTSNNYLMCLDYTGNIHTTSLKFKNAGQKRFKYGFQPRELGIMVCSLFTEGYTICLKQESNTYFLSIHKLTTEFNLEKIAILMCEDPLPLEQTRDKYILKSYVITENNIEYIKKVFDIEVLNLRNNHSLVIISFDRLSLYGCIFGPKLVDDEVTLVKLYTCPSEISNIEFIASDDNLCILIGMNIGTLISLNLKKEVKIPQLINLNTAIHKCTVFNETILYTDGNTMWKAENILSEQVNFSQLFIRTVNDFVKFGDQLICITYNNIIYTFSLDHEKSYLYQMSVEEYCSAEELLEKSEYLQRIVKEVSKNEALIKLHSKERNYICALSLSNRQDMMHNIIKQRIIVYESYEEAVSENTDVILTNDFCEYFHKESYFFLIRITMTTDHNLHDILTNSLGDLRMHITFLSAGIISKTTTIKLKEVKDLTYLIPMKSADFKTTDLRVAIKIVTNLPGALDAKEKIWTVLYKNTTRLHSEHFIKLNFKPNKNICLRGPRETLEELILQTADIQYGNICEFIDVTKLRPESKRWQTYVRLPAHYNQALKREVSQYQSISKKVNYFLQKFTSDDFLNSKSDLTLSVGKEKVIIVIENDGFSTPCMKVSSHDVKLALDIRNFISDLIYHVFADYGHGNEFINHSFYTVVENLQNDVRKYIINSTSEDIRTLIEQFEKKIIGLLPI